MNLLRWRRWLPCATVALALWGFSADAQAPGDLRVALVIGNAAYPGAAALANPVNDAQAMAGTLRRLGFSVTEVRNATQEQMQQAVAQVRAQLRGKQGIGLLFYAGHGVQLDQRNYMVPVDARLSRAADVPTQALDVAQVIDAFKSAGNRMNIVVLDACRDNPFADKTAGRGLAPMDAPSGTFLAYATAPGHVAEDGDASAGNGLYTGFLVKELQAPTARIEDVFKRVRLQVRQKSQGRQIPWESTSLEEDFYFDGGRAARGAPDDAALAQAFDQEKADWDRIRDSRNVDDFFAFLTRHPDGALAEQAQFRLDQLQAARVVPVAGPSGVTMLPSGARRFYEGDEAVLDLTDHKEGQQRRIRQRVTFADANRVEINGGDVVFDQMGSTLKNRTGVKDPPLMLAPAELAIGKRWRSAFTNATPNGRTTVNFWEARVVALEEVTVPAGTFRAFRVERRGEAKGPRGTTVLSGTLWIDPATMRVIRNDLLFKAGNRVVEHSSTQLVSLSLVPRPAR